MALPWLPAMLYYFCTSFILLYVLLTILIQYYELVLIVLVDVSVLLVSPRASENRTGGREADHLAPLL